jgi:hypothetical protein
LEPTSPPARSSRDRSRTNLVPRSSAANLCRPISDAIVGSAAIAIQLSQHRMSVLASDPVVITVEAVGVTAGDGDGALHISRTVARAACTIDVRPRRDARTVSRSTCRRGLRGCLGRCLSRSRCGCPSGGLLGSGLRCLRCRRFRCRCCSGCCGLGRGPARGRRAARGRAGRRKVVRTRGRRLRCGRCRYRRRR